MNSIDFITKPRNEQANYIKERLETLRRANYEIAKNMEQAQLTERDRQILQTQNEFNTVEQKIIEFLQKFNIQLETLLAIKKDTSPDEEDKYIKSLADIQKLKDSIIQDPDVKRVVDEWDAYNNEIKKAEPKFQEATVRYNDRVIKNQQEQEAFIKAHDDWTIKMREWNSLPKKSRPRPPQEPKQTDYVKTNVGRMPLIHTFFTKKGTKEPLETVEEVIKNKGFPQVPQPYQIQPAKPKLDVNLIQNEYSKYANLIIYTYGEFKTYVEELVSLIPVINPLSLGDIIKYYNELIKTFNIFLKTMYRGPPYTYKNSTISLDNVPGASGSMNNSKKFAIIETNDVVVNKLMDIVGENGILTDVIETVKGNR